MAVLVLADHDGSAMTQPTRSTVAAAQKLGEVHVLALGPASAAQAASKLPGVAKVLHSDAEAYAHGLAEPVAALLVAMAPSYSHLLAPASAAGKNVMPRVAAPFSFSRTASSTAISSKGFMDILTFAVSTPVPSAFTRTFTL